MASKTKNSKAKKNRQNSKQTSSPLAKEITLLASDYLPETFNLSAEMTAKQLSNGYLHCVTDDRWHAGNGI